MSRTHNDPKSLHDTFRSGRIDQAVDLVILEPLRLIDDRAWTPRQAAVTLWRQVSNDAVLRRARLLVEHVRPDSSWVAGRAAATLDAALNEPRLFGAPALSSLAAR